MPISVIRGYMKKVLRLTRVNSKVLRVLNDLGYEVMIVNKAVNDKVFIGQIRVLSTKNG